MSRGNDKRVYGICASARARVCGWERMAWHKFNLTTSRSRRDGPREEYTVPRVELIGPRDPESAYVWRRDDLSPSKIKLRNSRSHLRECVAEISIKIYPQSRNAFYARALVTENIDLRY